MNANTTDSKNSSELVEQVPGTPFQMVTTEKGKFLAMGKFRLTEILKTPEEEEAAKKDETWFRIMQVIQCMIDAQEDMKEYNAEMERNAKAQKEGLNEFEKKEVQEKFEKKINFGG